ncbi:MAG TPA: TetR/AcrR family transcriptional regulator [Candidatus Dormibacteraeota bacterium]|jgi:AcrR family transcriptional regulator|nr:TetR/AcrR family transcriptional regulator [Candidatus Dormibacteraeota bacterium]
MPSVTRRSRGHRERRDEIDERVLDTATDLLAAGEGYTQLSVERIAAASGVSRSTFYVHFSDKTDLLIRLAERAMGDIFLGANEWWMGDQSGGQEQLREVLLKLVRIWRKHEAVLRAITEVAGYDETVAAHWRTRINSYVDRAAGRLEEDRRTGRVGQGVDPHTTAFVTGWAVERTISEHIRTHGPQSDRVFAQTLARAIWQATYGDTSEA